MVMQLKEWSIRRGSEVAIGPFDFSLRAGEIVTVMGPSGVGKTTWLMSFLGYEELGLRISGNRMQQGKLLRPGSVPEQALYIPQHLPFNPNWEVQGFLGRLPWGNPRLLDLILPLSLQPKRLQRVREVLQQLGLAHRAKATVAELSGGETQRAAIAQMLLLSPKLLVGDEFVSALDPGMAMWILEQCRQELTRSGGAAILALHDVQTAMQVSDRILMIWPPAIDNQPWEIPRQTVAWSSEVLYALLCLARWAKDLPPSAAVQHLVRYLSSWLGDERSVWQFLEKCQQVTTVMIDDKGNIAAIEAEIPNLPPLKKASDRWTDMLPVRIFIGDRIRLGITISRGLSQHSLTILA